MFEIDPVPCEDGKSMGWPRRNTDSELDLSKLVLHSITLPASPSKALT